MMQSPNNEVRGSVTDDDDDDDDDNDNVKDGTVSNDHTVRFFIINNISRATSRVSDDDDDDDDDASSGDESDDASRLELIVEQVRHQESIQLLVRDGIFRYTRSVS